MSKLQCNQLGRGCTLSRLAPAQSSPSPCPVLAYFLTSPPPFLPKSSPSPSPILALSYSFCTGAAEGTMGKRKKKTIDELLDLIENQLQLLQETPASEKDDASLLQLKTKALLPQKHTPKVPNCREWQRLRRQTLRLLLRVRHACDKNVACLCILASSVSQLGLIKRPELRLFIDKLKERSKTFRIPHRLSWLADELAKNLEEPSAHTENLEEPSAHTENLEEPSAHTETPPAGTLQSRG